MGIKIIFKKPYIFWIIGIFFMYLFISFIISGFYNTIQSIIKYSDTLNWTKLIFSISLSFIIGILVSINSVMVYIKYKERRNFKRCKEAGAVAGIGTLGGLVAGFCPLCVTGLFPLIFSLFGISFSFASLPFGGLEFQIFVIIILLISLIMIEKK